MVYNKNSKTKVEKGIILKLKALLVAASTCLMFSQPTHATVVEFRTVVGDFQVNLFDETTPQTVRNFLEYVNSGAYANNVVHRSVPNFIVQGGGFTFTGDFPLDDVVTGPPVNNEPELSNVRGTISMAKLGGSPNSATSQWFINLNDNSANLDVQNGGFSAFGQVLGDGMEVVDAIANIQTFNQGGAFTDIPLRNVSAGNAITEDNLIIITDIVVIDASTVTNPDLQPVRNTLLNQPPSQPDGSDSGGGALGIGLLLSLAFLIRLKRT